MPTTSENLRDLVAFPTVSRTSNLDLIDFLQARLEAVGATCTRIYSDDQSAANLYAVFGPADRPGVMLSGHTDVVPVAGQDWSSDPFSLEQRDGALYGRGTADMKGFLAAMLRLSERAANVELRAPLLLAFSYDEEVGCVGVRSLIDMLARATPKPALCIIGEPTALQVATGHKGKIALTAHCRGHEAHSALAPTGLNAIHLAAEFIDALRDVQADIVAANVVDGDYDVPYSTVHAGVINGGTALNIVPKHCRIDFEIRNIAQDDPTSIVAAIEARAAQISASHAGRFEGTGIVIERQTAYPGLATDKASAAVQFVQSLTGANSTTKVAFGTEGGLFAEQLEVPVVVCGPGSMTQGHKPDEFVTLEQLTRCDAMLDALLERLQAGL